MIDIVIPLGSKSLWQDNELRFALRSIEKYAKNYREIIVIGNKPEWLKNVIHIPFEEKWQKEKNIYLKIVKACRSPSITADFLFTNDDIILLKEIDCVRYPFYFKGILAQSINKQYCDPEYLASLHNTAAALQKRNYAQNNFDTHCPIIYNKQLFIEAMSKYNWNANYGYVIKSLYSNTLGIKGQYARDLKIELAYCRSEIEEKIQGRDVFSFGDGALNYQLKQFLYHLFPHPSKYEK